MEKGDIGGSQTLSSASGWAQNAAPSSAKEPKEYDPLKDAKKVWARITMRSNGEEWEETAFATDTTTAGYVRHNMLHNKPTYNTVEVVSVTFVYPSVQMETP